MTIDVSAALLEQAGQLCATPRLRTVVAAHAGLPGEGFDCAIHPGDQMLLHSLRHHGDANAAFSQYFNVGLQQFRAFRQVWKLLGMSERATPPQVLDFACGYGRLLRFIVPSLAASSVSAAEIQQDALTFVQGHFGVETFGSAYQPDDFQPGRAFDLIWAASLFSHLSPSLFQAWLARLKDVLAPGGALCFSVHDECLLPSGEAMTAEGIRFYPSSENADLDTSAYGTTYVTEAYVRRVVRDTCGEDFVCGRIPRGLAHEQDLYVIARTAELDLEPLKDFRYGPWGWVDERCIDADGHLYLRGWAASLDDGAAHSVEISIDGVRHTCATGMLREDVQRVFADERLARSGWEFSLGLPAARETVLVEVSVADREGETALLYAGFLHSPPQPRQEPAAASPSVAATAISGQRPSWRARLMRLFGAGRPR